MNNEIQKIVASEARKATRELQSQKKLIHLKYERRIAERASFAKMKYDEHLDQYISRLQGFKNYYQDAEEIDFLEHEIEKVVEIINEVDAGKYNVRWKFSLEKYLDYLESRSQYLTSEEYEGKRNCKIRFRLSKNEVVTLFLMMIQNGLASFEVPSGLNRFLENQVKYFDDKEQKFKDIKNVKVTISKIKNDTSGVNPEYLTEQVNKKLAELKYIPESYAL